MEKKLYTIDAKGGKIGRIAAKAAHILTGKNLTSYARNTFPNVSVVIENTSKLDIPEKKLTEKVYKRYSGYPGGLYEKSMGQIIEKKGKGAVLRTAILGMLPKNKLKAQMIKNLIIKE
jgi:large subunit ribosomal protein L13